MEIKKPQLGKVGAFAIFLKREVLQHLPIQISQMPDLKRLSALIDRSEFVELTLIKLKVGS